MYSLAVLTNGSLASGSVDLTIKIWNLNDGSLINTLVGHTSFVVSLAVLKNGNLASGDANGVIKVWNCRILVFLTFESSHSIRNAMEHWFSVNVVVLCPNTLI